MENDLDLVVMADQYAGSPLSKMVSRVVRKTNEGLLVAAVRQGYLNFPEALRPALDSYTIDYPKQKWFGPQMATEDLGDLFDLAIRDAQDFAEAQGFELSDDQLFDVFNIAVMRVAHFAHTNPAFRKEMKIKKGWFS